MSSKDECRCEFGYYCRFCRLMDAREREIDYKESQIKKTYEESKK